MNQKTAPKSQNPPAAKPIILIGQNGEPLVRENANREIQAGLKTRSKSRMSVAKPQKRNNEVPVFCSLIVKIPER